MVGNGKEEWHDTLEKARNLIEEGRKEMAKATEQARERGEEAWRTARKKSREAWETMEAAGANAWEDVRDKGEEAWEDAEKLIRKYPSRAIGLTLLAGIIVGALISRDRD